MIGLRTRNECQQTTHKNGMRRIQRAKPLETSKDRSVESKRAFCLLYEMLKTFKLVAGGADKSIARPTARCILFDGENISFDASLVTYINSTNIPSIVIINRMYENQNLLSL